MTEKNITTASKTTQNETHNPSELGELGEQSSTRPEAIHDGPRQPDYWTSGNKEKTSKEK